MPASAVDDLLSAEGPEWWSTDEFERHRRSLYELGWTQVGERYPASDADERLAGGACEIVWLEAPDLLRRRTGIELAFDLLVTNDQAWFRCVFRGARHDDERIAHLRHADE